MQENILKKKNKYAPKINAADASHKLTEIWKTVNKASH